MTRSLFHLFLFFLSCFVPRLTLALPDLVIESGQMTSLSGRFAIVRVVVTNIGSDPVTGSIHIGSRPDWYRKAGFNSAAMIQGRSSSLGPGQSVSRIIYEPRALSWELTVDHRNRVTEEDEGNNTYILSTNRPPSLEAISDSVIDEEEEIELALSATDPDGDQLSYSVRLASNDPLPEGVGFDPETGIFTWTPDCLHSGNYEFIFTASDSGVPTLSTDQAMTLHVEDRCVEVAWIRTHNGPASGQDRGAGISVDLQGNIYVTGFDYHGLTGEGGESNNIWTRKMDPEGNEVWTRTHNGPLNATDEGGGIGVDPSGNVYVAGLETVPSDSGNVSNIWIRKMDSEGNVVWTTTYENGGGRDIAADSDGNTYVTGYVSVPDQYTDIWIQKLDPEGDEVWTRTYNGADNARDGGFGIAVDSLGNVYVTGSEEVPISGNNTNIWIRKMDPDGNELWTRTHDGSRDFVIADDLDRETWFYDQGSDIAVDSEGNVYVAGQETVLGVGQNLWVLKMDPDGNELWTHRVTDSNASGYGIALDSGGNVYVAGALSSSDYDMDIWTRKLDAEGNEMWTMTYGGMASGFAMGFDIAVDSAGNVYVTGQDPVPGESTNIWIQKYLNAPEL